MALARDGPLQRLYIGMDRGCCLKSAGNKYVGQKLRVTLTGRLLEVLKPSDGIIYWACKSCCQYV